MQLEHQPRMPARDVRVARDSLLSDNGAYALKDVSGYCDGIATYANITSLETKPLYLHGGHVQQICPCHSAAIFACELTEGNISIYGATFHWHGRVGGGGIGHHYTAFYAARSDEIAQPFTYDGLCKVVPATDRRLVTCMRIREHIRPRLYACSVAFPTVMGLCINVDDDPAHSAAAAGVLRGKLILTTAGLALMTTGMVLHAHNHRNLRRCVAAYNHIIE